MAVAAEHAFFYADYRSNYQQALEAKPEAQLAKAAVPELGPADFSTFVRASATAGQMALWTIHAVLVVVAAGGVVTAIARHYGPQRPGTALENQARL